MTDKSTAFGIRINILNTHQEKRTMFHLFRKTYIEVETRIDLNVHRIVISETHGYPVLEMLSKIYGGALLAFGSTYDDIFGIFVSANLPRSSSKVEQPYLSRLLK